MHAYYGVMVKCFNINIMLYIKNIYYIFVFLLACCFSFAQSQRAANWIFGSGEGVTFNQDANPIVLEGSSMYSYESASTMSDLNGQLLCYSNGDTIYDGTFNPMPNGMDMLGFHSSTQNSLILPHPNQIDSAHIYYVFTNDAEENNCANGLSYSVVNMKLLGNGTSIKPLGNVEANRKNVILFNQGTEKFTAIRHANGCDFWIIGHKQFTDEYIVFLLSSSGLDPTPLIQPLGTVISSYGKGAMKGTSDGKLLISAMLDEGVLEIYDFNNATGSISNPRTITTSFPPYGLAISPGNNKVYTSRASTVILQYDISNPTVAAITASETFIPVNGFTHDIQTAIDKKIYLCAEGTNMLHRLNFPDLDGVACGSEDSVMMLSGMNSMGLINYPAEFIWDDSTKFIYQDGCIGDTIFFNNQSTFGTQVLWDFGDPESGLANTSSEQNPFHIFSTSGQYTISLINSSSCRIDTIFKQITIQGGNIELGNDTSLCTGDSLILRASDIRNGIFEWANGDSVFSITIYESGIYILNVIDTLCFPSMPMQDSIDVVFDDCLIFIPNAFSPNGDGLNDVWEVLPKNIKDFKMTVYTYQGEKIFESNNINNSWNGMNDDNMFSYNQVYIYVINLVYSNGKVASLRGNISITK